MVHVLSMVFCYFVLAFFFFLLMAHKFVQGQDQCTNSGFRSLENKYKPLFFKEMIKVWDNVKIGGPYSASNTLLIDDKPYKALLNPVIKIHLFILFKILLRIYFISLNCRIIHQYSQSHISLRMKLTTLWVSSMFLLLVSFSDCVKLIFVGLYI